MNNRARKPLNFIYPIILFALLASFGFTSLTDKQRQSSGNSPAAAITREIPDVQATAVKRLTCRYYDEASFKKSISMVKSPPKIKGNILGGIVTHHLLADRLIADFFSTASQAKPEVVIIIAPNHKRAGNTQVQTGRYNWETPFGLLENESLVTQKIMGELKASENFDLLEEEHSIASLVPYVKYFMPQAKVVPLLVNGNYGLEKSVRLGKTVARAAAAGKTLIIASIDFSHYLPPDKADGMDEITLKAITAEDIAGINRMSNDNLDSPPSLIAIMTAMKELGAADRYVLQHDNSSRIAGVYSSSTTSYFTMLYSK